MNPHTADRRSQTFDRGNLQRSGRASKAGVDRTAPVHPWSSAILSRPSCEAGNTNVSMAAALIERQRAVGQQTIQKGRSYWIRRQEGEGSRWEFGAREGPRLKQGRGDVCAVLMWYGYAFEAIYIVLGAVLIAAVLGILIYHW